MDDNEQTPANPAGAVATVRQAAVRAVRWVRKHWGLSVAVVVPLVTVATIVIPLIADASTRFTSVDTLAVDGVSVGDSAPVEEALPEVVTAQAASTVGLGSVEVVDDADQRSDRYWRVRSDAPFDQFPLSTESGDTPCSPAQIAWLERWGYRESTSIWNGLLTLSNTATDGSSMSVRNIHSVGTFTKPEVPEVPVACSGGTGAGAEVVPMEQVLGTDSPATLQSEYRGAPAGSPAVLNIAPGEFIPTYTFFKRLPEDTYSHFAGSLVADVEIGGQTTQVTLFNGFTRIAPPEITTTTLRIIGTEVLCGPDSGFDPCTLELFIEQLHADPAFPG